jgi:hypothetical protein
MAGGEIGARLSTWPPPGGGIIIFIQV